VYTFSMEVLKALKLNLKYLKLWKFLGELIPLTLMVLCFRGAG